MFPTTVLMDNAEQRSTTGTVEVNSGDPDFSNLNRLDAGDEATEEAIAQQNLLKLPMMPAQSEAVRLKKRCMESISYSSSF